MARKILRNLIGNEITPDYGFLSRVGFPDPDGEETMPDTPSVEHDELVEPEGNANRREAFVGLWRSIAHDPSNNGHDAAANINTIARLIEIIDFQDARFTALTSELDAAYEKAAQVADYAVERAERDWCNPDKQDAVKQVGREIAEVIREYGRTALNQSSGLMNQGNEVELAPCRECGAPGRREIFGAEPDATPVWICSKHKFFGGKCPVEQAYLTEDAWNERKALTPSGDDALVELIARLRSLKPGPFTARARDDDDPPVRLPVNPDGPEAADAIAALVAERDEMRVGVETAAVIFEEYGRLHRKKGTREGDLKAERNEQYAAEMRSILNQQTKDNRDE